MNFKQSNCIVVFDKSRESVLFCKRRKDPFKGLYNFVGGKLESGEDSEAAAYRELQEETGIGRNDIRLYHLMDLTYYHLNFVLEIYVGVLEQDVCLQEEVTPLEWLSLQEDFTDKKRFAGEQNIAHIINIALQYPFPDYRIRGTGCYIGVDGCRGGWIAAIIENGSLKVVRYETILQLVESYPIFDGFLIDMAIGLQESADEIRPDNAVRHLLAPKTSTVFPVPVRQAVYAEGEDAQKNANLSILGKSLAKQSLAIIPKIKELDVFLDEHREYKNVICESHPELCFARLNGSVVLSKKKEFSGFSERAHILSEYVECKSLDGLWNKAKELKCQPDDIMDAVCLAVTAGLKAQDMCETVPENPQKDARGLLMQMIVPCRSIRNKGRE